MKLSREELEQQAKLQVCACWYYDLTDDIDVLDDEILYKVIEYPKWLHIQNQKNCPVSANEFLEELTECRG